MNKNLFAGTLCRRIYFFSFSVFPKGVNSNLIFYMHFINSVSFLFCYSVEIFVFFNFEIYVFYKYVALHKHVIVYYFITTLCNLFFFKDCLNNVVFFFGLFFKSEETSKQQLNCNERLFERVSRIHLTKYPVSLKESEDMQWGQQKKNMTLCIKKELWQGLGASPYFQFARSFHSSPRGHFPLADYNVNATIDRSRDQCAIFALSNFFFFERRRRRGWGEREKRDMIGTIYMKWNMSLKFLVFFVFKKKKKKFKERFQRNPWEGRQDTLNKSWQKYPWWNLEKLDVVPCTLLTNGKHGGRQINFVLRRSFVESEIEKNLRNKCTLYNLHLKDDNKERLTAEQKNVLLQNDKNEIYNRQEYFFAFLKHMQKRYLFEDVESLHFEEYIPDTEVNLVIPCRFYGLDQWWPSRHMDGITQWKVPFFFFFFPLLKPSKIDRPKYVQHEHEVELRWTPPKREGQQHEEDNIYNADGSDMKVPSHLSITVEQFCLPWKKEITLNDVHLPDYLRPMRPPHEIKILSLDFSHSKILQGLYETDKNCYTFHNTFFNSVSLFCSASASCLFLNFICNSLSRFSVCITRDMTAFEKRGKNKICIICDVHLKYFNNCQFLFSLKKKKKGKSFFLFC
ncbi:hypothetical protein RFI_28088 [Reticulomyxa filosa]|uniref:Uncharacterized protein n=1 Tax=Reticulomyxa filosa TaxID=46433 RepID=X6M5U4_RETFI|nr:hypothetical protein RFI_28088 [Reticulomyxa filosa]|eukprot:ETO09299.1 hypothetical protein RFI_28088 [Reticulomyxa filosa]